MAPVWQAQPWWPVLLTLLISQPVLLPESPTLLTDPTDLNRVHPMYPRLHLVVFHISTNVSKLRAFHQTLPIYSSQQLVPLYTKPTSLVGTVGAAGVLGPVVQKPINADPRLKINQRVYCFAPKCCSTLIFGKTLH